MYKVGDIVTLVGGPMVKLNIGDPVTLVRPYVSVHTRNPRHPYGKQLMNKLGAKGTVVDINPRYGVRVKWDVPYRSATHSGWRKPFRFAYGEGPW